MWGGGGGGGVGIKTKREGGERETARQTDKQTNKDMLDMLISTKIVKVFPNNKTWTSKSIKSTLNEKKIAFQTGDRAERKRVQAKLTRELREGKKAV